MYPPNSSALLIADLIGQKQICVKQKKCYADIFIAKGEKWRQ